MSKTDDKKGGELIGADDEPVVRLLAFGLALLAISTRQPTLTNDGTLPGAILEARGIADAVVEEAKRLQSRVPCCVSTLTTPLGQMRCTLVNKHSGSCCYALESNSCGR